MDLGLKDEIACEIAEFKEDNKDERIIAKALYLPSPLDIGLMLSCSMASYQETIEMVYRQV